MSMIILDIDHFKQVNDTYGHLQGDVVLQKVALHLQKELRSYDIAARYGGEEFIAVLPDAKLKKRSLWPSGSVCRFRISNSMGRCRRAPLPSAWVWPPCRSKVAPR